MHSPVLLYATVVTLVFTSAADRSYMLLQQQPVLRFPMQITEAYLQSEEFSNLNKIREMIRSSYQMVAAPFRFLSLLREHQTEEGLFKCFAVTACNRNTHKVFH